MTEKHPSPARNWLFALISILIGPLLMLILGEIIFRFNPQWVADPPAPAPYNYRIPDEKFGWYVQEGYRWEGEMRDHAGTAYPVKLHFGKNGFRSYGNPAAEGRKRVLIVGDSYTACAQTSDEKTWHHLLADSLPVEVFAYGAAGYGTTQEYLICKEYLDGVRPDIVVLMFCTNDFIDNYWELEKRANYHVRMPRPYTLEDGSLVTRYAAEYPRNIKPWSNFIYWMIRQVMLAKGTFDKPPKEPSEKLMSEQQDAYPPFAKSQQMTGAALRNLKGLLPEGTPLIGVSVDGFEPAYSRFERICRENQIQHGGNLPAYLQQFEAGECIRTDDGYHWNDRGNALVAAYLKPRIEDLLNLKK